MTNFDDIEFNSEGCFLDVDIEIFEDNPEEYIRKDIERSDVDTRRRAASDLVQALSSQFEKQVVAIFSSYVNALLQAC